MKNIDKVIHWKLLEISIVLAFVIVSFPLWQALEMKDYLSTAAFYSEAQYSYLEVSKYPTDYMIPISDEVALNHIVPCEIQVINNTKTREDYSLVLKVSKNSTLDYRVLKIALNNNVSTLESHYILEDADSIYFSLQTDSIQGERRNYDFIMWMDQNTGNDMQGKSLSFDFELQKGIAI